MEKLCANCKSKSHRDKNIVKSAEVYVNYHIFETQDKAL